MPKEQVNCLFEFFKFLFPFSSKNSFFLIKELILNEADGINNTCRWWLMLIVGLNYLFVKVYDHYLFILIEASKICLDEQSPKFFVWMTILSYLFKNKKAVKHK